MSIKAFSDIFKKFTLLAWKDEEDNINPDVMGAKCKKSTSMTAR